MPRLVSVEVDPVLATNEPDEQVQDLLRASPGTSLGVDFLPGSLDLDVCPVSSAASRSTPAWWSTAATATTWARASHWTPGGYTADGTGPEAAQETGRRFRWLTAPRSTVVQPGPVHTGLTGDPGAELDRLLAVLVLAPS